MFEELFTLIIGFSPLGWGECEGDFISDCPETFLPIWQNAGPIIILILLLSLLFIIVGTYYAKKAEPTFDNELDWQQYRFRRTQDRKNGSSPYPYQYDKDHYDKGQSATAIRRRWIEYANDTDEKNGQKPDEDPGQNPDETLEEYYKRLRG